jgi:hypothetical protein
LKKHNGATVFQQAALDERRVRIVHNISRFRTMLATFLPEHNMDIRGLDNQPELTRIILPSSLSDSARASLDDIVLRSEIQLRLAAAQDALTDLLNELRARQLFNIYRRANIRGTRGTIAASESIRRCSNKVMLAASAYRRHRAALEILEPEGSWAARLKVLNDSDIRRINECALTKEEARERNTAAHLQHQLGNSDSTDADDELSSLPIKLIVPGETGDRHHAISWIWHNSPALNEDALTLTDPALVRSLRVQWAKAKIRAHHWRVQLLLVCEEMRRSLVFIRWKGQHWSELAAQSIGDDDLSEGKRAYALKHASAYDALHNKWAMKWHPLVGHAKKSCFKEEVVDLGVKVVYNGPILIIVEDDWDDTIRDDSVRSLVLFIRVLD